MPWCLDAQAPTAVVVLRCKCKLANGCAVIDPATVSACPYPAPPSLPLRLQLLRRLSCKVWCIKRSLAAALHPQLCEWQQTCGGGVLNLWVLEMDACWQSAELCLLQAVAC